VGHAPPDQVGGRAGEARGGVEGAGVDHLDRDPALGVAARGVAPRVVGEPSGHEVRGGVGQPERRDERLGDVVAIRPAGDRGDDRAEQAEPDVRVLEALVDAADRAVRRQRPQAVGVRERVHELPVVGVGAVAQHAAGRGGRRGAAVRPRPAGRRPSP